MYQNLRIKCCFHFQGWKLFLWNVHTHTHTRARARALSLSLMGYSESNLWWAVNKSSNHKKMYYIKKYTLTLPLEMGKLYHGISFCLSVPKKSSACDLNHVLITSIIVEVLWSQPVLQVGASEQVVVVWSEIRAIRRVVKQLWVEMLQQYSNASSCMWTCIAMEEHFTGCQHSSP
jgi:hypothetical protein